MAGGSAERDEVGVGCQSERRRFRAPLKGRQRQWCSEACRKHGKQPASASGSQKEESARERALSKASQTLVLLARSAGPYAPEPAKDDDEDVIKYPAARKCQGCRSESGLRKKLGTFFRLSVGTEKGLRPAVPAPCRAAPG